MATAQKLHRVRIKAPFYDDDRHAGLHRYLDTEFISRFQQDVRCKRFDQPQFSAWQAEETHSRHDQKPVLRLPAHRAFHLVSCEIICEQTGSPALCPKRITSAGFVIRRVNGGREQAWMLEDGEALGWQEAPTELRDPDIYRRLCASGVLQKRTEEPAYSGEQTHPMHTLGTEDDMGRTRTLLFGFVPLGGFYYLRNNNATDAFDPVSLEEISQADAQLLPWPFGYRTASNQSDQTWLKVHSRPVDSGRPAKEMFELLRLLINRYHLGESNLPANSALENIAGQLWFFTTALPAELQDIEFTDQNQDKFTPYRKMSLWAYLKACFDKGPDNPLVPWLINQETDIDRAGGLDHMGQLTKLPATSGSGKLNRHLFMTAADAQNLRELLGQRLRDQALGKIQEIPLPKFGQGVRDIFQIVPFVRFLNDNGKEQIQWADDHSRSCLFRVAAPFDPQASRPSLIQMPSLADLKRGLAKGASMLTPGDTFDLISALNTKKGATADAVPEDPGPGLGIQWICSFSLPVITLVAMILLMIMISLLNIIFFWMPWVRICLPFPKIKE